MNNTIEENLKLIHSLQQRNTELNGLINKSKEEVKSNSTKVRNLHKDNLVAAGLK